MKSREEYIDKMSNQLKEWSTKIDELEAKAGTVRADLRAGYDQRISDLKERRQDVARRLQELKSSSGEAWDALTRGLDSAWNDFKEAFSSARDKFKKAA